MVDNFELDPAAGGGPTIAADDVSGVLVQRVKQAFGADGVATDVDSTNPLPVHIQSQQASTPVDGAGQTTDVNVTLDGEPVVLGAGTAEIGKLAAGTALVGSVNVDGAGQTNDVKVTLDTEPVVLGAGTAEIGKLAAGVAAIGKLSANSGVDIGDVDVTSQPARVRTTDAIASALQTDAMMDGLTAITPKFAVIDDATLGNNTIVAAVASKKIRVVAMTLIAAGDVVVRFESGASGTALTGQMNLTTNSGMSIAFCPVGLFETGVNTLLNLELSAAISVDGFITYIEV